MRFSEDRKDVRVLGPRFPLRRLGRGTPVRARVRGVGDIWMRPGTSDLDAVREVLRDGAYDTTRFPQDRWLQARYAAIAADGRRPLIIDLGANIGAASAWFATRYPEARVVAVEPDPGNAALCRRNTADLGVTVLEKAAGSRPGRVRLVDDGMGAWGVQTVRDDGGVEITTVPDIIAAHPDAEPFLLKVDIEGFEDDLFADGAPWLGRFAATFVEPHDWAHPAGGRSRALRTATAGAPCDLLVLGASLVFVAHP